MSRDVRVHRLPRPPALHLPWAWACVTCGADSDLHYTTRDKARTSAQEHSCEAPAGH